MDAAITAGGWGVPRGAAVYDAAGEKLGTVAGADLDALTVERGFLFPTSYAVPLRAVARYEDGALHLSLTKAELDAGDGTDA